MLGDVEVQNASTTMSDDKEAIEHTESNRRHGEEVHRRDGFPVISNKGEPAFGWLRVSRRSFHPPGNRSFRDIEKEHEKSDSTYHAQVIPQFACERQRRILLKSQAHRVLANHTSKLPAKNVIADF